MNQQVNSRSMEKHHNNSILKYLLVLCLGLTLIFSQSNRLHMHLQHDDHSSNASGHVINVHMSKLLHDINLVDHKDDDHSTAIDINPDNLVKKTNSLNPLVLILLYIGLFLYIPRLICLPRQRLYQILFTPCYYFIQPPLRAPPNNSTV